MKWIIIRMIFVIIIIMKVCVHHAWLVMHGAALGH